MNYYGTLAALQPILRDLGITMHRCRRHFSDEPLYFLKSDIGRNIFFESPSKRYRRGYSLTEVLNWLYLTAETPVSQRAHTLLVQLNDDAADPQSSFEC